MIYDVDSIKKRKEKSELIKRMIVICICVVLSIPIIYKILLTYTNIPWYVNAYTITSDSMYPTLREGDIIIVKNIDKGGLKKGDIISFKNGTEIITHRIREVITINGEEQYITKGDNNKLQDKTPILYEEIEGKEIYLIPYVGYAIIVLKNKFVIIALFILIISRIYLKQRKKTVRKRKKEDMEKNIYGILDKDNTLEGKKKCTNHHNWCSNIKKSQNKKKEGKNEN